VSIFALLTCIEFQFTSFGGQQTNSQANCRRLHFHPRLRCKFAAVHNCKMRMGNTVGCIVANGSNFSNPVRRDASLFGACNGGVDLVRVRQLVSPSHRLSLVQVPAPNSRIQRDPAGARGDRTACGELVQGEMSRGETLSKCDSGEGDRSKSRVSTMSSWVASLPPGKRGVSRTSRHARRDAMDASVLIDERH
jgi:hypothetical protein